MEGEPLWHQRTSKQKKTKTKTKQTKRVRSLLPLNVPAAPSAISGSGRAMQPDGSNCTVRPGDAATGASLRVNKRQQQQRRKKQTKKRNHTRSIVRPAKSSALRVLPEPPDKRRHCEPVCVLRCTCMGVLWVLSGYVFLFSFCCIHA